MIQNGVTAKEFRERTQDRDVLDLADKIYVGTGDYEKDAANKATAGYKVEGKNIIDAINGASGKTKNKFIKGEAIAGAVDNAKEADHAKKADEATLANNATNAVYSEYARYADDTPESMAKGTIEERLNNLGFKNLQNSIEQDIVLEGTTIGKLQIPQNSLTREGYRVILRGTFQMLTPATVSKNDSFYNFYFNSKEVSFLRLIEPDFCPRFFVLGSCTFVRTSHRYFKTANQDIIVKTNENPTIDFTINTSGDFIIKCISPSFRFTEYSKADDNYTSYEINGESLDFTIGYETKRS